MAAVQIGSWKQYNEIRKTGIEFVPVILSDNYIFVGPSCRPVPESSCLGCLINSLRDNESFYYPLLKGLLTDGYRPYSGLDLEIECELVQSCEEDTDNRVHIISRGNMSVNSYPVYKHPACEACVRNEKADETLRDLRPNYTFNKAFRIKTPEDIMNSREGYENLINPHTGIGQYLFRDIDAKIMPMYFVKSDLAGREFYSYGRTSDLLHSKYAAIFEMLERYSSLVPHTKNGLYGSYRELSEGGYEVLHPRQLVIPENMLSAERGNYSDDQDYRWKKVLEFNSGKSVYLPEQVIYYDSQLISKEKRFVHETSNGCALGGSIEEAIVYALFELVERDSFLVHWYNRIAPVKLDVSKIENDNIARLVQYMENKGFRVHIFDITMETKIPTIWTAIVDEEYHGRVKCYNAAGAHINPEKALEGALVEAITSIFVYNNILESGKNVDLTEALTGAPDRVKDMEDHVYFYANQKNFSYIREFYENESVLEFKEVFASWYRRKDKKYTFKELMERVSRYHPDIYIAYLYTDINRTLGLECVKMIIPSMLTMTFGNNNKRINYERVQEGPVIAGLKSLPTLPDMIYDIPHPFP
ncbi:MAG: hypothetical protein H6Q59_1508 [Firmicutes bacterium]|nr:hypothetical protein [Bacillota bacterium]